jgi:hypothetical protein
MGNQPDTVIIGGARPVSRSGTTCSAPDGGS